MKKKATPRKAKKHKYKFPPGSYYPDKLMDDERISKEEAHTWIHIERWCRNKDTEHPSTTYPLKFLAKKRKVEIRTIQRHIKKLKETGWLSNRRRFNMPSVIILNREGKP